MRPEVLIAFWTRDVPQARALVEPAGCGRDVATIKEVPILRQVSVEITLLDTDERLPQLLEILRQQGMEWTQRHEDRYTDEELDNARLLFLRPSGPCEVDGGSKFGTTYDLSGACPACGAGARQNSALFLDGDDDQLPKLKGHRAGYTYREEVFVDERLAAELAELAPTGLLFHNVYALMPDKRQVKLHWKQLSADRTLPPMSPSTIEISRNQPCGICQRSGYTTNGPGPNRIAYRASDLEGAGDVNLTWEGNGLGKLNADPRKSWLPVPWLLVTPKVMRVFRAAGVTEFDWLPIRVVDE